MHETITATVFKARCAELLDEVTKTGKEIVITRRGKKIARLVRVEEKSEQIWGRMKGTVEIRGDIFSTGEKWEADSDEPDRFLSDLGK
jgi:prevent-host-death family protein